MVALVSWVAIAIGISGGPPGLLATDVGHRVMVSGLLTGGTRKVCSQLCSQPRSHARVSTALAPRWPCPPANALFTRLLYPLPTSPGNYCRAKNIPFTSRWARRGRRLTGGARQYTAPHQSARAAQSCACAKGPDTRISFRGHCRRAKLGSNQPPIGKKPARVRARDKRGNVGHSTSAGWLQECRALIV